MGARTAEREQYLADIITAAVEGGTGYWAQVARYKWEGLAAKDVHAVLLPEDCADDVEAAADLLREAKGRKPTLDELLAECDDLKLLDIEAIARGIGRIRRGEVQINGQLRALILAADAENDAGDIDADAADAITQIALLGEITYG